MKRFVLVLLIASSIDLVGSQRAKATPPAPPASEFPVLSYGAKCDGSQDDTSSIQAAINAAFPGGTVVLPAARCIISDSLLVGDVSGQQRTAFISLRGSNPITSQLYWIGPSSGVAVKAVRNKYFTFERFGLLNGSARGTSIGLALTGFGSNGTETLQGDIRQVNIQGFSLGIHAGDPTNATSEMRYDHVELSNADACWKNDNLNTLNHVFTMISLGNCGVGLWEQVGNVLVRGGSTWGNAIDFRMSNGELVGVRAELASGGTFLYTDYAYGLHVRNNLTTGDASTATAVYINAGLHLTLEDNVFFQPIVLHQYCNNLSVLNNHINGPAAFPMVVEPGASGSGATFYTFVNNTNNAGNSWTHTRYPDAVGSIGQ